MEEFARVVVRVDPSGGTKKTNDEQGIVAVGRTFDGQGYGLADRSCKLKPKGWARRAVQLAIDVGADVIAVERNYCADMAVSPLEDAAEELGWKGKIKDISASRGKRLRAEPVAVLYGDPDDPETWDKAVMHHVASSRSLRNR
jgi:phage terminase large subunit-like protein